MNKSNFTIFLGKAGQGKTSLLISFLNTSSLFKYVYDNVIVFMPTNSRSSIKDNFFDIGGDSLKAGRVVSSIRSILNVNLSVADLFQFPTIEDLAGKVSSKLETDSRHSHGYASKDPRREKFLTGGAHPAAVKGT
jgi:acyl carrier protein